jgi:hypothetical protein
MAKTLQMVMTASVHPRQPLSLIQDGADGVSPAQGSGLCSILVDKKDKHVCSLLVQNSLLSFNTILYILITITFIEFKVYFHPYYNMT